MEHGGASLLARYGFSIVDLVRTLVPEAEFFPWLFQRTPQNFWDDRQNHVRFFKYLGEQEGCREDSEEGWYKLTLKVIQDHGGSTLMQTKYQNSPFLALSSVFPNLSFLPWRFGHSPHRYWEKRENQKQFLNFLYHRLRMRSMDDWYSVSQEDFEKNFGGGLLACYHGSPSQLLRANYPDIEWVPWKFSYTPQLQRYGKEDLLQFLKEVKVKMAIETMNDWYRLSQVQVRELGGQKMIAMFGGLAKVCTDFDYCKPANSVLITSTIGIVVGLS